MGVLLGLEAILAGAILFLLPGFCLLLWLLPDRKMDWLERLTLSAGLSLAFYPLFLLWTHTFGIRPGRFGMWFILVAAAALTAWRFLRRSRALRPPSGLPEWFGLAAGLSVLVLFFTRLWPIRDLTVPLWGDSYQHTLIAQLIVDNGGLFESWLPYAPLQSFTYHYGFHTAVAFFHWLTGIPMPSAVLLVGQLLNALAVLCLYPLALRLTGSRWAALLTVIAAGLFSSMPSFYVNWGRYTQLAGQLMLPVALWFGAELVENPRFDWKRLVLAGITLTGMVLGHYRITLFFAGAFFAWWLVYILLDANRWPDRFAGVGRLALVGGLTGGLLLPWILHLLSSRLAQVQVLIVSGHHQDYVRDDANLFGRLNRFVPYHLLGLTGLGALLGASAPEAAGRFLRLVDRPVFPDGQSLLVETARHGASSTILRSCSRSMYRPRCWPDTASPHWPVTPNAGGPGWPGPSPPWWLPPPCGWPRDSSRSSTRPTCWSQRPINALWTGSRQTRRQTPNSWSTVFWPTTTPLRSAPTPAGGFPS